MTRFVRLISRDNALYAKIKLRNEVYEYFFIDTQSHVSLITMDVVKAAGYSKLFIEAEDPLGVSHSYGTIGVIQAMASGKEFVCNVPVQMNVWVTKARNAPRATLGADFLTHYNAQIVMNSISDKKGIYMILSENKCAPMPGYGFDMPTPSLVSINGHDIICHLDTGSTMAVIMSAVQAASCGIRFESLVDRAKVVTWDSTVECRLARKVPVTFGSVTSVGLSTKHSIFVKESYEDHDHPVVGMPMLEGLHSFIVTKEGIIAGNAENTPTLAAASMDQSVHGSLTPRPVHKKARPTSCSSKDCGTDNTDLDDKKCRKKRNRPIIDKDDKKSRKKKKS